MSVKSHKQGAAQTNPHAAQQKLVALPYDCSICVQWDDRSSAKMLSPLHFIPAFLQKVRNFDPTIAIHPSILIPFERRIVARPKED